MAEPDPGGISLQDCKELLAGHKDSPFDLDAFVHLPEGFFKQSTGEEIRIHTQTNCVCDKLAKASDYRWKWVLNTSFNGDCNTYQLHTVSTKLPVVQHQVLLHTLVHSERAHRPSTNPIPKRRRGKEGHTWHDFLAMEYCRSQYHTVARGMFMCKCFITKHIFIIVTSLYLKMSTKWSWIWRHPLNQ